ncbi:hypothetical protein FRB93_013806 [Tulasnella sp. JGI-2019a]|nr:hypothetical protein FRB93_013806 [Tulasnella sp. JGI-2019a]
MSYVACLSSEIIGVLRLYILRIRIPPNLRRILAGDTLTPSPQAGLNNGASSTTTASLPHTSTRTTSWSWNMFKLSLWSLGQLKRMPTELWSSLILSTSWITLRIRSSSSVATATPLAMAHSSEATGDEGEPARPVEAVRPSQIGSLLEDPILYDPIRKPRNPIILCHGLYGFDVWAPSIYPRLQRHYWLEILDILRKRVGAEVIVTSVPSTGSIQDRAKIMDVFLQDKAKGRGINFMAHSMGGLDCRQLITHVRPTAYTPLSLTTVSTPHRGSPFMDWCNANIGIGTIREAAAVASSRQRNVPYSLKSPILRVADAIEQQSADAAGSSAFDEDKQSAIPLSPLLKHLTTLPRSLTTMILAYVDTPAYANLTTSYLNDHFNPRTPNMAGVRYFSVAAKKDELSVFHPLWLPKFILDKAEEMERQGSSSSPNSAISQQATSSDKPWAPSGAAAQADDLEWGNDGLVTISSAKWGEFLGTVDNCDHWDIRGDGGFSAAWETEGAAGGLGWVPEVEWSKWLSSWWGRHSNESSASAAMASGSMKGISERGGADGSGNGSGVDWLKENMSNAAARAMTTVSLSPAQRTSETVDSSNEPSASPWSSKERAREAKFNLERLYVALSRKLYDEGL